MIVRPFACLGIILITLSSLAGEEGAAEGYDPHAHPAHVDRRLTAFTRAFRSVNIAAEDTARLLTLIPAEGARIEGEMGAYTPIAQLDAAAATLRLTQAQAAVLGAQAAVAEAEDRLRLAQRDEAYSVGEQQRIVGLFEKGSVSSKQRDDAVFAGEMSQLRRGQAESAVAMAKASVTAVEAEASYAQFIVGRHGLTAPAGWLVAERHAEPGALVNAGQPVLTVLDVDRLLIPLRLSESALAALRAMDRIPVTFVDGSSTTATIHRIDPRHDPVSRKRLCELVIDAADAPEASGGIEVSVALRMQDPAGNILIPRRFLTPRLERWVAQLADGQEISVVPLRVDDDAVAVAKASVPEGALLISPPRNEDNSDTESVEEPAE